MSIVAEPTTLIGLGVLLVSNVGLWIDKYFQGKKTTKLTEVATAVSGRNGTSLDGLHVKVDALTAFTALISTSTALAAAEIINMKTMCTETKSRYEKRFEKLEDK